MDTTTLLMALVPALVGGGAGYLAAYLQTRESRKAKRDEIAQVLTALEMQKAKELGIPLRYSALAHFAVIRTLLDAVDDRNGGSLTELRDKVESGLTMSCPNADYPACNWTSIRDLPVSPVRPGIDVHGGSHGKRRAGKRNRGKRS